MSLRRVDKITKNGREGTSVDAAVYALADHFSSWIALITIGIAGSPGAVIKAID